MKVEMAAERSQKGDSALSCGAAETEGEWTEEMRRG